jgi:2-C-methyl-D-erythritol 4-phosphate cytidylyltransferase
MKHFAILLAGGNGSRMNTPGKDKLIDPINDTNSFRLCYEAFLGAKKIDNAIVVYRDNKQKESLEKEIDISHRKANHRFNPIFVKGGKERKDSVQNAIINCPANCKFIYIHDCARPMIQSKTIDQLEKIVTKTGAVVVARPLHDTIKIIEDLDIEDISLPCATKSIDRSKIWVMETPQVSRKDWLEEGIKFASNNKKFTTDEVSVLELVNKKISLFNPQYPNPKITSRADWSFVNFLLSSK